jgi:hypothetical protein
MCETPKEEVIPMSLKLFQKTEKETSSTQFHWARITVNQT